MSMVLSPTTFLFLSITLSPSLLKLPPPRSLVVPRLFHDHYTHVLSITMDLSPSLLLAVSFSEHRVGRGDSPSVGDKGPMKGNRRGQHRRIRAPLARGKVISGNEDEKSRISSWLLFIPFPGSLRSSFYLG